MGNSSYLCLGCKTGIRDNELALLRHIRHGRIVGQVDGLYDGYGRVKGDGDFRHDGDPRCRKINSAKEMSRSEYDLPDSGKRSGIQAWHMACFDGASPEQQTAKTISESDPKQGEGRTRPEFATSGRKVITITPGAARLVVAQTQGGSVLLQRTGKTTVDMIVSYPKRKGVFRREWEVDPRYVDLFWEGLVKQTNDLDFGGTIRGARVNTENAAINAALHIAGIIQRLQTQVSPKR